MIIDGNQTPSIILTLQFTITFLVREEKKILKFMGILAEKLKENRLGNSHGTYFRV